MKLYRIAAQEAEMDVIDALVETADSSSADENILIGVTMQNYLNALKHVIPLAMREIFVETPQVSWDDIGGQEKVKEYLEEAVVWPFKVRFHSEIFQIKLLTHSSTLRT